MNIALPFTDRNQAARALAERLGQYRGVHPVVLAIPRGAVPMGRVLADALGAELDIVLVRKLGAPYSSEFAVGAIDDLGWVYIAPHAEASGADEAYLKREIARQREVLEERNELYRRGRPPVDLEGRIAILVDDGLATGATMKAALHAARARHPARLICAVPVASAEALHEVRTLADETVCLAVPRDFSSVGHHYLSFRQIDDAEVIDALRHSETARRSSRQDPPDR